MSSESAAISPVKAATTEVEIDAVAIPVVDPVSFDYLFKWNLFLGIFHTITGIVIFLITKKDAVSPVFSFFPSQPRGGPFWGPVPFKQYNNIVGYFSGIFLLLAGVDHFLCATFARSYYEDGLKRFQNHFRWVEYFFSASFMHIQVGMLSGMFDLHLLFTIYGLTATTMMFGSLQEIMNEKLQGSPDKKSLLPFWMGCIPHLFNWLVLLCFFFVGVKRGSPPAFVWAIIFIIFILDATFAVNQYLQQREIGKWKNYLHGEYVFCVLSLVSKQLLAWLNYGGTNSI